MIALVLAVTTVAAGALLYALYRDYASRSAAARVDELVRGTERSTDEADVRRVPSFPPRYPLVAPSLGIIVAALLRLLWRVPYEVDVTAGALVGVLAYLAEAQIAEQRAAVIETQLAAAIDLLVASLRAGASLLSAFDSALQEAEAPLKAYFQEVAGRIRLGDDPRQAVADLPRHVPLENFRLFATSLAIHWEVGGSLATTLATVGRTVRDRIELARRVRAQGIEANASVAVVLGLAYVLGFLMWRANPDRIEALMRTGIGTELLAGVIGLQAIGLIWMSRLSRSTF